MYKFFFIQAIIFTISCLNGSINQIAGDSSPINNTPTKKNCFLNLASVFIGN